MISTLLSSVIRNSSWSRIKLLSNSEVLAFTTLGVVFVFVFELENVTWKTVKFWEKIQELKHLKDFFNQKLFLLDVFQDIQFYVIIYQKGVKNGSITSGGRKLRGVGGQNALQSMLVESCTGLRQLSQLPSVGVLEIFNCGL